MNKRIRQGLGALIGIGVAALSIGAEGCARTEIYEAAQKDKCMEQGKTADECCVNIDSCGRLCYEGMADDTFFITLDGDSFMYSTETEHLYPGGCHLKRGAIDNDSLVVTYKRGPFWKLP